MLLLQPFLDAASMNLSSPRNGRKRGQSLNQVPGEDTTGVCSISGTSRHRNSSFNHGESKQLVGSVCRYRLQQHHEDDRRIIRCPQNVSVIQHLRTASSGIPRCQIRRVDRRIPRNAPNILHFLRWKMTAPAATLKEPNQPGSVLRFHVDAFWRTGHLLQFTLCQPWNNVAIMFLLVTACAK